MRTRTTLLLPLVLSACAPALTAPNASGADGLFLQAVTGSNLFELQSSRVALTTSTTPAVRSYAQMLLDDHLAAQNQVAALAVTRGVPLPKVLPPELQLKVVTLSGLNSAAFDAAYLQEQVLAHQLTLSLIQNERAAGRDPSVTAFAERQAPVIQGHLQRARTLLGTP